MERNREFSQGPLRHGHHTMTNLKVFQIINLVFIPGYEHVPIEEGKAEICLLHDHDGLGETQKFF